jgi:hypothetical protein
MGPNASVAACKSTKKAAHHCGAAFCHLKRKGLEHLAQNLKQIFAARMLYLKVLDRPDVLHK